MSYFWGNNQWKGNKMAIGQAILGGAGALFGGLMSGIAARKARKQIEGEIERNENLMREEDDMFRREYYRDYTQGAQMQNNLRQTRQLLEDNMRRQQAVGAMTGGTAEAGLQAGEQINKAVADQAATGAAAAEQGRAGTLAQHRSRQADLENQRQGLVNAQQQAYRTTMQSGAQMINNGSENVASSGVLSKLFG